MIKKFSKTLPLKYVLLGLAICVIVYSLGYGIGYVVSLKQQNVSLGKKVNEGQNVGKLATIINLIDRSYVDKVNKDELVEKSIYHIVGKLDPHTTYIPAKDYKKANEGLEGFFGGIGIQFITYEDTICVVRCIENGPSQKEGLLAGDRIVTVNDSTVAGINITTTDIMMLLKGKVGTFVQVGIKRKNEKKLYKVLIQRNIIPIKSIEVAYMLNPTTGYIYISRFSRNSFLEFKDAIKRLQSLGMEKLIIDLRANSGGFMGTAIAIVNEFLPRNTLIVFTKGKSKKKLERRANGQGKLQKLPIVVLINEASASASEIFAGAIQDNDRGLIVGRRSFGKGLVQEAHDFKDGSSLRLTVSRYYTPTGRCIQKPYNPKNKKEYFAEISKRYEKGEFQLKEYIKFTDSLKKVTPKGKIVYGGGGIMPDIFVPLDTTEYTPYYSTITQKGILRNFSYYFVDLHREKMKNFSTYKQVEHYVDKQNYMKSFLSYANKKGVKKNYQDYRISKNLIASRLKALIGSDLLGSIAYYSIIHKRDKVVKTALSAS